VIVHHDLRVGDAPRVFVESAADQFTEFRPREKAGDR
jgi:hypothetical protein